LGPDRVGDSRQLDGVVATGRCVKQIIPLVFSGRQAGADLFGSAPAPYDFLNLRIYDHASTRREAVGVKMDWLSVFQTLGTVAIGSGVLAFVLRGVFNQVLSRDLERFKADLKTAAFQRETRFSRLHADRATVITELYKRLAKAHSTFTDFIRPFQMAGEESHEDRAKEAAARTNELFAYFDENRVCFDEELCQLVEKLQEACRRTWSTFALPGMKPASGKQWWEAWEKWAQNIPPLRREIEKRFQKMLGVE